MLLFQLVGAAILYSSCVNDKPLNKAFCVRVTMRTPVIMSRLE